MIEFTVIAKNIQCVHVLGEKPNTNKMEDIDKALEKLNDTIFTIARKVYLTGT
jgi:hypothetical protein